MAKRPAPTRRGRFNSDPVTSPEEIVPRVFNSATLEDNKKVPAAQYVRMSTDLQEFSIANQEAAISDFAVLFGYTVVKTYSDAGRSGVSARKRPGLCALLSDVINGKAPFKAILVYDVSRWGRFQNYDEAGHYEFLCHRAGICIHYCAEPFGNDGSILSGLMKNLKRIMASEYSRELGVKVFAGQARIAAEGFKIGGTAGFGLRRLMMSIDGTRKSILHIRERKGLKTDRVVFAPGPQEEIKWVRKMYSMVLGGSGYSAIARTLNRSGVLAESGSQWTYDLVKNVLTNPKYMGCNTWGRTSQKLHSTTVHLPLEQWIRRSDAFPAIITPNKFFLVQQKLKTNIADLYWTDEEILSKMKLLLKKKGKITTALLDYTAGMPHSQTVARRFEGLKGAYQLIGYKAGKGIPEMCKTRTQTYHLRNRIIRVIERLCPDFKSVHLTGKLRPMLLLDHRVIVAIKICPANKFGNSVLWALGSTDPEKQFITLLCRCRPGNRSFHSFYVMPKRVWKSAYRFTGNPHWLSEGLHLKRLSRLPQVVRSLVTKETAMEATPSAA
jgi:DNA invertase Pin-like site-specific DNA recombinase